MKNKHSISKLLMPLRILSTRSVIEEKKISMYFKLLFLMFIAIAFSSCGSMLSVVQKERPVRLMQAPGDLEVYIDGKSHPVTSEVFAAYENISWYTAGIKLPYKKNITIELRSEGKSVMVPLRAKPSKPIFCLNLIFFPIVSHIIDAVSKNNRILKPNYVDVEYALQGKPQSEWRSKGKLKRKQKRQINKNANK